VKLLNNIVTFAFVRYGFSSDQQLILMKRIFFFLFLMFCSSFLKHISAQNTSFNYTQTCFGDQTTLVASSTLPDASISTWQWDLDGNGTYEKSGKIIISLFTSSNPIPVKLKITPTAGPADSAIQNVTIDPLPLVNFIANNLCETRSATYISQSTIDAGFITQYLWDFNNDGVTDDNSNDTVNYTCGPAQTYLTKLTCVSNKGCSAFAQKVTTVYSNPVAGFVVANTCFGNNTLFTNTTTTSNPDYYTWDFGDGAGNVSAGNTVHGYATAGNYNVQLIAVTQAGCRDTVTSAVTIHPNPAVTFQFSGDTVLFAGSSVTITVAGGSFNYSWSSGESTDNITVSQTGTYTCQVTDANGCTTDLTTSILVKGIPDSVVVSGGSILTPNDDNINDVFMIDNIAAYSNCDLNIYSMWNDEVYSVKGYKNDWKGTNKSGEPLPAGAYYYIIKCDDKQLMKGNINILR
jgi:gliding motility-associated-like protein